ncbi:threonine-phosphate decarboxylase CobD [Dyella caseinilytica]|uniref:threonine-phosphate decarboxylase n=1 Tax=Dyella caseinilytica TaxID=1849581 RepID=A0ABX7GVB0_9GAMM|nr:threonine-phosphate decarboxylase CobD [Dyella caseinilytica]QRN54351.1 threonine-phosphate decarboxylase [Dyella caseinilytica]GFZ93492.1 threonine-phosphate decarboxylase [Dyella caseinilytica]
MLEHGGRLQRAAHEYGIPLAQWLDLSTGISPFGWPIPAIPSSAWQRLPEDDDGLIDVARAYYEAPHVLPVAGSQAAIQALPLLRSRSRVGIIAPGYAEHAHAWRRAGHDVTCLPADALLANAAQWDVLVLIHPNNPGGERFRAEDLLRIHDALMARGGWLLVDEAFMDVTPQDSLCRYTDRDGLIVLRSVGKFFGLAGARAGFVCAAPQWLEALREKLGPWTMSGPTRYVLQKALADCPWQAAARVRLDTVSRRLSALLAKHGLGPTTGCGLFQWCLREDALSLHRGLAKRGILTRLFDTPPSLRFGLLPDEAAFQRLDVALAEVLR